MPQALFVPGRLRVLEQRFGINCGFDETRPGRSGRPGSRMVDRQMPAARAAHGKTADRHPRGIDSIMPADVLHRFEYVDFSREFECVAVTPIRVQDETIRRSKLAVGALAVGNKFEFREMIVTAMKPHV